MSTPALNSANPYAMDDFAFNNTRNAIRQGPKTQTANVTELDLADAAEALSQKID